MNNHGSVNTYYLNKNSDIASGSLLVSKESDYMAAIKLIGYVDSNGRIELPEHIDLPAADVIITIEPVSTEDEAVAAAFDELLASPKVCSLDGLNGISLARKPNEAITISSAPDCGCLSTTL